MMANLTAPAPAEPERRSSSDPTAGEWAHDVEDIRTFTYLAVYGAAAAGTEAELPSAAFETWVSALPRFTPEFGLSDLQERIQRLNVASLASVSNVARAVNDLAGFLAVVEALPAHVRASLSNLDENGASALTRTLQAFAASRKHTPDQNLDYAGPWADTPTVREYLGNKSRQAISRRVATRTLLGVKFNDDNLYYPVRQFVNHSVVPGLKDVLDELSKGVASPKVWSTWLAGPALVASAEDAELLVEVDGRTWWDELAAGNVDTVLAEARRDAARWAA